MNKRIKTEVWRSTKKCIICLVEATDFTGHVLKGKEIIFAGWCDVHVNAFPRTLNLAHRKGCCGGYLPVYGLHNR